MRLASRKRLPLISLRTQALRNQRNRRPAFLQRRLARVQNQHGPRRSRAIRNRLHRDPLIRRSLIVEHLPFIPALARRSRRHQLHRPGFSRPGFRQFVGSPSRLHRRFCIRRLRVKNNYVRVRLRRCQHHHVCARFNRPPRRHRESRPARRNARSIRRHRLRRGRRSMPANSDRPRSNRRRSSRCRNARCNQRKRTKRKQSSPNDRHRIHP